MKHAQKFSADTAKELGIVLPIPDSEPEKLLSPNDIGKILGVTGEAVKHGLFTVAYRPLRQ